MPGPFPPLRASEVRALFDESGLLRPLAEIEKLLARRHLGGRRRQALIGLARRLWNDEVPPLEPAGAVVDEGAA